MRQPSEPLEPVDTYLHEASKHLRRRVPESVAESRLAEAREHLNERAEELIAGGMSAEQAQAAAVSAFGPAREWARSIAEAVYSDPRAVVAGRISAVAAITVVLVPLADMITQSLGPLNPMLWVKLSNDLVMAALCILAVSSLRARRSRTLLIGVVGGFAAFGAFIYFGSGIVKASDQGAWWFRRDVTAFIRGMQAEILDTRSEIGLLSLGIATYSHPTDRGGVVPQSLRTSAGAYITPVAFPPATITPTSIAPNSVSASDYIETDLQYWIKPSLGDTQPMASAFKTFTPRQIKAYQTSLGNIGLGLRLRQAAPYHAVATVDEARAAWKGSGPAWLDIQKAQLKFSVSMLGQMQRLAAQPAVFDGTATIQWVAVVLIKTLAAIFFDLIAAHIGRFLFRRGWGGRAVA